MSGAGGLIKGQAGQIYAREKAVVLSYVATAAISPGDIVQLDGADDKIKRLAADTGEPLGVALRDPNETGDYAADDLVPVALIGCGGIVVVNTNAAVTRGKLAVAAAAANSHKAIDATALSATVPAGGTAVTSTSNAPAMTMASTRLPIRPIGSFIENVGSAGTALLNLGQVA
jgi:hypothetical protein